MLVSAGFEDVVRELLGAGADVKATNDKGLTALYERFSKDHLPALTDLLSQTLRCIKVPCRRECKSAP